MQRKRDRGRDGRPRCVDSRGKKRGAWFIALGDLHSASRSRRTNLDPVPILNSSARASYASSTRKSRTRGRGSGVFSNLRERVRVHGIQSLYRVIRRSVRVYVWREKEDLAIVYFIELFRVLVLSSLSFPVKYQATSLSFSCCIVFITEEIKNLLVSVIIVK